MFLFCYLETWVNEMMLTAMGHNDRVSPCMLAPYVWMNIIVNNGHDNEILELRFGVT